MPDKQIIRTTCPRDCYDSCGLAAVKRNGKLKILGDPDHPVSRGALCGKCAIAYNGVWRDPQARLGRPLRRRGAKGGGDFEAISWEVALGEIAARLSTTLASHGPSAILHAHYTGTCSLIAGAFPERFFNRLGATEVDPDTICNNAGHVALDTVYGSSTKGFDPRTARDSRCILVWGANPSASAPHAHRHWLKESPAKVVVVDPIRHPTAEAADLHLQNRPGSDAALAFAMLHVLQREGLIDRAFIEAHTLGWDELTPLLSGCTPDWGEQITGVPAGKIEEAARLYGGGPSLLWLGQGLQRQPRGGNVMRACALLPAVTGNIGRPGAGIYYLNGSGPRNIDGGYVSAPQLRREPARTISHMDLAEVLADPARARVLFSWNMNVAASGPRQTDLRRALAREDLFTVVAELFMTDTARSADIVLPAASFLEFDDLMVPYFHLSLSAQVKVEEPPGEALPNQEIFRRLAREMGYEEPELYEDDRQILDRVLAKSGLGVDFAALARRGTIEPWPEPIVTFADLNFPTPSGRIEIASARAEAAGLPRVPQPAFDPPPAPGRLRLLSPAGPWLMNDSYGNDPAIREKLGPATVTLHPADAGTLGLAEGGRAMLSNDTGRIELQVAISEAVPPGTALSHKGRWPQWAQQSVNVNILNPGAKTDMGESSSVHGIEVEVTPVAASG
ncbi:MAG: molybdopterin-dependent oxidoreductase [Rhodospirillales bacterium]|nr:molybdopterin-dependent oxidoreductase [Rhodospirillales bacterium]